MNEIAKQKMYGFHVPYLIVGGGYELSPGSAVCFLDHEAVHDNEDVKSFMGQIAKACGFTQSMIIVVQGWLRLPGEDYAQRHLSVLPGE